MIRNFKLILCIVVSLIVTCSLLVVIHKKIKEADVAVREEVVLEDELDVYKNLKTLMENQRAMEDISRSAKAIILRQSFINALKTGNASHALPIPLNDRKKTVIFSSWRSGSTFIGDIFNTVAGNYYHYEPFNFRGHNQVETKEENIEIVKSLLKCQYQFAQEHMKQSVHWFFNKRLAHYCPWKNHADFCGSIAFRNAFCDIFPRQSMKLVRARVTLAESLLEDPELNVNVLLQVRDPRAVHLSRENFHGCNTNPDCYSMQRYCAYLVEDYNSVQALRKKYPTRVKVIRFEDLASKPTEVTKEIFEQFGIVFDDDIEEFLMEHTKFGGHGIHSTFRNSEKVMVRWMTTLSMKVVTNIQAECKEAMKLWGYRPINNQNQLNTTAFEPLEDFK